MKFSFPFLRKDLLRKIFLINIIVIILSGCTSAIPHHYSYTKSPTSTYGRLVPIYIDHTFGEEDRLRIDEGIEQWNYALNGNLKLAVIDWNYHSNKHMDKMIVKNDGIIIIHLNSQDIVKKNYSKTMLAFADQVPGHYIYFIRDRIGKPIDLKLILMHEMGHVLGAKHQKKYLMTTTFDYKGWQCVDYDTLVQVAKVQGFDVKTGNYCYHY